MDISSRMVVRSSWRLMETTLLLAARKLRRAETDVVVTSEHRFEVLLQKTNLLDVIVEALGKDWFCSQ